MKIRELNLPVEVCPSCHEKLGWWNPEQDHPVKRIYKTLPAPVPPGTDDEGLFESDAETEMNRLLSLFPEYKIENTDALEKHFAQFCFYQGPSLKLARRNSYPPNVFDEKTTLESTLAKQVQTEPGPLSSEPSSVPVASIQ